MISYYFFFEVISMKFFTRKNILYTLLTVIILAATMWSFVHIITNDTRKDTEAQMRELSNQSLNTISQKLHADSVCLRFVELLAEQRV